MKRYVVAAAALGVLNAVTVLLVLAVVREVEQYGAPDFGDSSSYGWFSYTPLTEDTGPRSRFPWDYVVPPVVVAVVNAVLAAAWFRRSAVNPCAALPPAP